MFSSNHMLLILPNSRIEAFVWLEVADRMEKVSECHFS